MIFAAMPGDKVVMNDMYPINKEDEGKVYEIIGRPFSVCGCSMIRLKGRAGAYSVKGLDFATCEACGRKHNPREPHDRDSMIYCIHFNRKHGRNPTWHDAMAHCSDMVKELWTKQLQERGIALEN